MSLPKVYAGAVRPSRSERFFSFRLRYTNDVVLDARRLADERAELDVGAQGASIERADPQVCASSRSLSLLVRLGVSVDQLVACGPEIRSPLSICLIPRHRMEQGSSAGY